VADLLECLIQIKGLAETPRRLGARVRRATEAHAFAGVAHVARRLALAEARFASCLTLMLSEERPALPSLDLASLAAEASREPGEWLQEFGWRRGEVLRLLDRCSAADLGRVGFEPARGPMTVADLVAVMLAHDTDRLGELRF